MDWLLSFLIKKMDGRGYVDKEEMSVECLRSDLLESWMKKKVDKMLMLIFKEMTYFRKL